MSGTIPIVSLVPPAQFAIFLSLFMVLMGVIVFLIIKRIFF